MNVSPAHATYEYRLAESIEEVNRLAAEEGWELQQAVFRGGADYGFVLRRLREGDLGRRVGFSG
ncbi:MAG: hypothetical protein ACREN7_07535 [Candidatus Dormibacteria bacterium]